MKKFQQGGTDVFNLPNIPAPDVGVINPSPLINLPAVPAIQIASMANSAVDPETRRRRADQDLLARQKQTEGAADEYFASYDSLFGELHNDKQRAIIAEAKRRHNITDDTYASIDLNNYAQLKSETAKLQRAVRDPKVMEVLGEVEAAKEYLKRTPVNLSREEVDELENYRTGYFSAGKDTPYDVRKLDGNLYQRPAPTAAAKPFNFDSQLRANSANWLGLDLTDPAGQDMQIFKDQLAYMFLSTNPDEAVTRKFITVDDLGSPTLTDLGLQAGLAKAQALQQTYNTKREDKIEDHTTKRQINQKYPSARTSPAAAKVAKTEKEFDQINSMWNQILSTHPELDAKFGHLDYTNNQALADYLLGLATTEGVSGKIVSGVDDIEDALEQIEIATSAPAAVTPPAAAAGTVPELGGTITVPGKPVVPKKKTLVTRNGNTFYE